MEGHKPREHRGTGRIVLPQVNSGTMVLPEIFLILPEFVVVPKMPHLMAKTGRFGGISP